MTNPIADPGHGHSPAAWTAIVIMLIALSAGTVFFCMQQPMLVWICTAVMLLGPLVGWIMAKAGYGVKGPKYTPKSH